MTNHNPRAASGTATTRVARATSVVEDVARLVAAVARPLRRVLLAVTLGQAIAASLLWGRAFAAGSRQLLERLFG